MRGLAKRYGPVAVIHDLSLEVADGEFLVFLGPSGCGKSTLLRMVAGLEPLSAGEIHLAGRRIDALVPGARGVAMVFQNYALYPHMTVRDNMAFGLRNIATPREAIAQKIAVAAQLLEIDGLLDRKPNQLSGGQRQRVAIGRAIVKEPQVFLFDEPLSNLDAGLRGRTRIELARLHARVKATMIFVTHDQVEAMTMATRIAVMNEGRVEQIGAPMEIYSRPATRFVAAFIGSPPMNFLPVTLAGEQGGRAIVRVADGTQVATEISIVSLPSGSLSLGIRAEHVTVGAGTPSTVDVVERLGERTLIYALTGDGATIVYDEPGHVAPAIGERVVLSFDPSQVMLFDAAGQAYHRPELP